MKKSKHLSSKQSFWHEKCESVCTDLLYAPNFQNFLSCIVYLNHKTSQKVTQAESLTCPLKGKVVYFLLP